MKYANFINSKNTNSKVVELKLNGEVTATGTITPSQTNGFVLSEAIGYFSNEGYRVKLLINSYGGNLISTMSVISQVEKHKVDTHITGVAFSSAGLIAIAGNNRTINNYGSIMVHSANIAGEEGQTESEKAGIESFNNSITRIISDRTSITHDSVSEMMKTDTFIDSDQALSYGMVDNIVQTGKPKLEVTNSIANVFENACKTYNSINNDLQMEWENKFNDLQKEFIVNEARLKETDNKYLNIAKEKDALAKDKAELEKKVSELSEQVDKAIEAEANNFLNSKNIKLEGKALDLFINSYKGDKEGAMALMASVPTAPAEDLTDFTNTGKKGEQGLSIETLNYYENDPKGQKELFDMGCVDATMHKYDNICKQISNAIKKGDIK